MQAGALQVRVRRLMGCDGARSSVRKLGGFDFAGTEPEFTGYAALADLDDPTTLGKRRQLTPRGMAFQSQPGYLAIQEFDGRPVTPERLQEVLRRGSGVDLTVTALHAASTWTDRARQATRYRDGRALLAGDAAHVHGPLGGQGRNLGLGDAVSLGWKLAATIKGTAPAGLLDTAGGATYMAGRVWGVETRYDLGGDHPLIGRSAPDFEFADGRRLGQPMHEGSAILLDFKGDAAPQGRAAAYGLASAGIVAVAWDS